jgi:N-acylneuraminate cytidylyltransferase
MRESRRIVALIPARGGSKGIPRKNLAPLAGKPLLVHTLDQARATPAIDRIVVSTDDDEIARCAATWGAEVVRRPAELASDEAASEPALVHALDALRDDGGYEPDLVVFLQATSPLRRPGDVARAIATLEAEDADSLFSACPVHGFVWRRRAGELEALTYDPHQRQRRQDLGEDLLENGSIYVFKPWVLRRHGNRLGGRVAVYPMDPLDSFQVDEPVDLELFEQLLLLPRERRQATPDLSAVRLLVLDFDGVMTDDRVTVDETGREAVVCSRSDGFGLERLLHRGRVDVAVLSKETNPVVAARCRKLGVTCFQGYDDKLPQLERMAAERGLAPPQIAYVGNDVNDLEPMRWCGVAIAVADARAEVRAAADFVTRKAGGHGAVREVCDLLLAAAPPDAPR